jgi:hypothetical protein
MGVFRIFAWRPLSSCHWSLTSCSHRVDPTVVLPRILGSPASPVHESSPNVSALRGRGSLQLGWVYIYYTNVTFLGDQQNTSDVQRFKAGVSDRQSASAMSDCA